jgi:hypothetical protein
MEYTEYTKFLDADDNSFIRTCQRGENIIFNIKNSNLINEFGRNYIALNIETAKEFIEVLQLNIDMAENSRFKYNPNNICKIRTK